MCLEWQPDDGPVTRGHDRLAEIGLYRRLMATVYRVHEWLDSETTLNNDPGTYCEGDVFCTFPWARWPSDAYISSEMWNYDEVN